MQNILVAALYQFATFQDFAERRQPLLDFCVQNHIKGTLLLAAEGINGTIAGSTEEVHAVIHFLRQDEWFPGLEVKESHASIPPFYRMKVRLKKEIVTMGVVGIDPQKIVGTYVPAEEWNQLLRDPGVVVVDTRNDYEVAIGTFEGAKNPNIQTFRAFPRWLRHEFSSQSERKVAMFCTGGIRCEKSTAFLKQEGVREVFHLKGGILKYLEIVPESESLWRGECFVFDQRVAVVHGLKQGSYQLCRACRYPINAEDQLAPEYEEGVSCRHCYSRSSPAQKSGYAERHQQMKLAQARKNSAS